MNKTSWLIIGITVLIIGGGIFLFSRGGGNANPSSSPLPLPAKLEYYWRVDCVHCENVDKFIASWDKKDKLQMDKFEVSGRDNTQRMIDRAVSCKLDPNQVGTPLLFTPAGICIDGDTPIIDYLKNNIK